MERGHGFNFKLWMPPRVNNGQTSADKLQETAESRSDFSNMQQLGYNKCHEKEQTLVFPNTSVVAPTKPTRPDFVKMKVVAPMEKQENNDTSGQVYSKLFDEVEKMKCWKVKVDSDLVQKNRRLQENTKIIESQRKAIRELQFDNERLSTKLLEQCSENEDLRNKNNTTGTLCGILNETFQRSAEKMHLYESEREETHQLFAENCDNVKKLIEAFDTLRVKAEDNQQQMHKVKKDLLLYEDLKEKYQQEYKMKEEEIEILQAKLRDKENKLQITLGDLHKTEKQCQQLQESTREANEQATRKDVLISTLKNELDVKSKCIESIEAKLDASQDKLLEHSAELSKKIEEIRLLKVSEEKAAELKAELARMEKEKLCLREESESAKAQVMATFLQTEAVQKQIEKNFENLQQEIKEKEKGIEAAETKLRHLGEQFEMNFKAQEEYKKEIELLKRKLAKETAKFHEINSLYEESQNLQRLKDEDLQKLQKDLEAKSTFSADLEKEVQELKLSAAEAIKEKEDAELKCQQKVEAAIKEKEDAELKCQQKITHVLTLMDKHQGQCDQRLKEKEAELDVKNSSLELDLSNLKLENDELNKQLKMEKADKEKLEKELTDLKKELSMKISELSHAANKQSSTLNSQDECSETPGESSKKSRTFDFFDTQKTPSWLKEEPITAITKKAGTPDESIKTPGTLKAKQLYSEDMTTLGSVTRRAGQTSKIKAYRVRTPPSAKKPAGRGSITTYLEPKLDSSDEIDLLSFDNDRTPSFSAPYCKSPAANESQRNSLKLAAIRRMRAAGWTAVVGLDKKRKRSNENIFA